jgi:hypothetical protein
MENEPQPDPDTSKKSQPTPSNSPKSTGDATERPAKMSEKKKTTQYVVTVDNATGFASKIEKLDEATGDRTELTRQQYADAAYYAAVAPYVSAALPSSGAFALSSTPTVDPRSTVIDAYYRGVSEYLRALSGLS